jgi:hypothetical protein
MRPSAKTMAAKGQGSGRRQDQAGGALADALRRAGFGGNK